MRLLVRDNGKGFDAEQDSDGFGLLGMRERIALLDGELEIESAPQRGTVIRARLPVQRQDSPAATAQARNAS